MAAHRTRNPATIRTLLARSLRAAGFALFCSATIAPLAHADTIPMVNQFPFAMPWDFGPRIVRLFGSIQPADAAVLLAGQHDMALAWSSRVNQPFGESWPAPIAAAWPDDVASLQTDDKGNGAWAMKSREFTSWP
ncbi:hypothetical protein [Paraburkholderia phosphatilytica]|uniref:hypothetical protein n=1 Tax=Paraburkholderia phosphatilytica TaxID=2282883 RepID=UPI000E53E99C|nr:hypothetical protein [Paraburkholderia phosphatilytica]